MRIVYHSGEVFNNLTIVRKTNQKKGSAYLYECRCKCGNTRISLYNMIKRGDIKDCGKKCKLKALSYDDIKEMCESYEAGMSIEKLSDKYGTFPKKVSNILKENNVKVRFNPVNRTRQRIKETREKAIKMYLDGKDVKEISKEVGVTKKTVYSYISEFTKECKGLEEKKTITVTLTDGERVKMGNKDKRVNDYEKDRTGNVYIHNNKILIKFDKGYVETYSPFEIREMLQKKVLVKA